MKNTRSRGFNESKIFIENEQSVMVLNEQCANLLEKTVITCLQVENMDSGCEINILLTDDASIRQINRQFRDIDHSTDVLSFPMINQNNGRIQSASYIFGGSI